MLLLYFVSGYLLVGILFAGIFLIRWIHQVDEGSAEAPWTFKLIIFPGCVVFWPVLLKKYLGIRKSNHRD